MSPKGRPRIYCSARAEGLGCTNKGTFLDIYEAQLEWYLEKFSIPADYQARILQEHHQLESAHAIDWHARKEALQSRLRKLRELYEWGHLDEREYLGRHEETQRDLDGIAPAEESGNLLDKLAQFLGRVADAWRAAGQEQRNKLARSLFEEIFVEDSRVVLVKPRSELQPFFGMNWECHAKDIAGDPEGDRVQKCNTRPMISLHSVHRSSLPRSHDLRSHGPLGRSLPSVARPGLCENSLETMACLMRR